MSRPQKVKDPTVHRMRRPPAGAYRHLGKPVPEEAAIAEKAAKALGRPVRMSKHDLVTVKAEAGELPPPGGAHVARHWITWNGRHFLVPVTAREHAELNIHGHTSTMPGAMASTVPAKHKVVFGHVQQLAADTSASLQALSGQGRTFPGSETRKVDRALEYSSIGLSSLALIVGLVRNIKPILEIFKRKGPAIAEAGAKAAEAL
jgi:hypothetical protein